MMKLIAMNFELEIQVEIESARIRWVLMEVGLVYSDDWDDLQSSFDDWKGFDWGQRENFLVDKLYLTPDWKLVPW